MGPAKEHRRPLKKSTSLGTQDVVQNISKLQEESTLRSMELNTLKSSLLSAKKEKELAEKALEDFRHQNNELRQELDWSAKELGSLQKQYNDLRCHQWLEQASGRSTVLARLENGSPLEADTASPGKVCPTSCNNQEKLAEKDARLADCTTTLETLRSAKKALQADLQVESQVSAALRIELKAAREELAASKHLHELQCSAVIQQRDEAVSARDNLQHSHARLEHTLAEERSKVTKTEEELLECRRQNSDFEARFQSASTALALVTREKEQLASQCSTLRGRVIELEAREAETLEDKKRQLEASTSASHQTSLEKAAVEQRCTEQAEEITALSIKLQSSESRSAQLAREVSEAAVSRDAAVTIAAEAQSSLLTAEGQLRESRAREAASREERDSLERQLRERTQECGAASGRLSAFEEAESRLRAECAAAAAERDALQGRLSEMQGAVERLKQQQVEAAGAHTRELGECQARVLSLESELRSARAELEDASCQLGKAREALEGLQQTVEASGEEVEGAQALCTRLKAELECREAVVAEQEGRIAGLCAELEQLGAVEREVSELRSRLVSHEQAQREALQGQLERLEANEDVAQKEYEAALEQLAAIEASLRQLLLLPHDGPPSPPDPPHQPDPEPPGELNRLARITAGLQLRNGRLSVRLTRLQGCLAKLEMAWGEQQGALGQLQAAAAAGDAQVKELAVQHAAELEEQRAEAAALREKIASYKAQCSEIDALKSVAADLQSRVERMMRFSSEQEQKVGSLTSAAAERERANAELQRRCRAKDEEVARLQGCCERLEGSWREAQGREQAAGAHLADLNAQLAALQAQVAEHRLSKQKLQEAVMHALQQDGSSARAGSAPREHEHSAPPAQQRALPSEALGLGFEGEVGTPRLGRGGSLHSGGGVLTDRTLRSDEQGRARRNIVFTPVERTPPSDLLHVANRKPGATRAQDPEPVMKGYPSQTSRSGVAKAKAVHGRPARENDMFSTVQKVTSR